MVVTEVVAATVERVLTELELVTDKDEPRVAVGLELVGDRLTAVGERGVPGAAAPGCGIKGTAMAVATAAGGIPFPSSRSPPTPSTSSTPPRA